MSLEKILQALEAEAVRQVVTIEQECRVEVERIHTEALAKAEQVRQKRLEAIQAPLRIEQARILNEAKLKALRTVLGAREDLITAVLETTARRLADLSNTAAYSQLLPRLLKEAVDKLGRQGQLRLRVQPQDVEIAEQIVQEMGLSAKVEGNLQNEGTWNVALGGLIVTTSDERISLVNTLEARLQRVASLHRTEIVEMILDHGGEW